MAEQVTQKGGDRFTPNFTYNTIFPTWFYLIFSLTLFAIHYKTFHDVH